MQGETYFLFALFVYLENSSSEIPHCFRIDFMVGIGIFFDQ